MIRNPFLTLGCLAALTLTACESVQRDVDSSFNNSTSALQQAFSNLNAGQPQDQAARPSTALALNGTDGDNLANGITTGPGCPIVRIVSDLNQVHQFADGASASPRAEISTVYMQAVDTTCKIAKNSMVVDMNIAFSGGVGPKGRTRSGDKPSFAYPYFVAITNNQGSIIGKEVFALTMNYGGTGNNETRIEQVRQVIPLHDKNHRNYQVLIGFQISDQELAYNRALPPESMSPSNAMSEVEPASGKVIESLPERE
ncbi:MAG: putative lipoprotein [Micavibrio sp.]|nr:putative lipoprotein [Micavibrio sp.]